MNVDIIADGIEYNMNVKSDSAIDIVTIKDVNNEVVADAVIDNNIEQIFIQYFDNNERVLTGEYNYYEWLSLNSFVELSVWMASTHPING